MKILIINSLYYPNITGGAEISVQYFAEALAFNHQVVVVSLTPDNESRAYLNGVEIYYVPLSNIYWAFQSNGTPNLLKPFFHIFDTYNIPMSRKLSRIIESEKPDLMHTNNLSGFTVSTWQLANQYRIPLVHTLRDYYLLCPRSKMFKNGETCQEQCWECKLFSSPRHTFSKYVKAVVGNSKFILDRHLDYGFFNSAPIKEVIFNAYRTPETQTTNVIHIDAPLRVGYLGRLSPEKGIEYLLRTILRLPPKTVNLVIAGEGDEQYEHYLARKYQQENIKFLGFINIEHFFTTIDVLVVPSRWEDPLPRVIYESYSFGVPVIGSLHGGIPEIIIDGQVGFLFDPQKHEHLYSIISNLICDRDQLLSMQANCVEKFKEFQPENIVNQYIPVYDRVLNSPLTH